VGNSKDQQGENSVCYVAQEKGGEVLGKRNGPVRKKQVIAAPGGLPKGEYYASREKNISW